MRLKDYRERPFPAVTDRADGRADFRRMMTVVVDHQDSIRFAFDFKAPVDAGETAERVAHLSERNFQFMSDGDRRQGIGRAMTAGQVQTQLAQAFGFVHCGEFDPGCRHL